jgi:hypothetical protein
MRRVSRGSWWLGLASIFAAASATAAGCGSSGDDASSASGFDASTDGGALSDGGTPGQLGGGSGDAKADGPTNTGPLVISPAAPVVIVTRDVSGGTTVSAPTEVDFTATYGGVKVTPTWSLDRGELGTLLATGAFDASGTIAGVGQVTATYGKDIAAVPLTVKIVATENGGSDAVDGGILDGGPGGYDGVGGKGPGLPVDGNAINAFADASVPPSTIPATTYFPDAGPDSGIATYDAGTAEDFQFLYPYDQTIFPLGMLAPLLQWRSTHASQTVAVHIHLSEDNFSFDGSYAFPPVGTAGFTDDDRSRQPIDASVWRQATYSNGGATDPLEVDVKILTSDGTVYGPITEHLTIAQGVLTGTVYYNSYRTSLNGAQGGVLAIKPGAPAPTLAVPGLKGQCHVCHSVAADGKTLFVQDDNYDYGSSYDLTDGGALIQSYHSATSSDGTTNIGKFTFSGVYPDGTMGMACSGPNPNWHHYAGDSDLFGRADGNKIASTGFDNVIASAATPAFSPDGTKMAFSLWATQSGADAGGITTGSKSLVAMDFSCGADAGSVACTSEGAFSNLRQLFSTTNASEYVAWPSFTPDAKALIFQHTLHPAPAGSVIYTHGDDNTGYPAGGAKAQLRYSDVPETGAATPRLLCALNGLAAGCDVSQVSTLPAHPTFRPQPGKPTNTLFEVYDDTTMNYEPTINPVASGGYYWVVFTSRRRYGNVAAGYPYDGWDGQNPTPTWPITKKLWVAAIDATTGEIDPSHPAFYLPGQELTAGNMRGFWVVDPCEGLGSGCATGEECCSGFCRPDGDGGALVCSNKPSGACSQDLESCTTNADCCDAPSGETCTNGRCAKPAPPAVPR